MADLDPVVKQALDLTRLGVRELEEVRRRRYDHAYQVYRASRRVPLGIEKWQSALRVPYAMQTIDTALVNLVQGRPRAQVRPRHPANELGAKAMQYVLDYYAQEDGLARKQAPFVQQALITGLTAAKVPWVYRKSDRTIRVFDEQGKPKTERVSMVAKDGPSFEPWNVYHIYWQPGATSVESAQYVVLQSYLTKDELLRLAYNPETDEGQFHNVQALIEAGPYPAPRYSAQDRAVGASQLDRYTGRYLVEEIWENDTLTVIGNRQILLSRQDNPYWHGRKPIVISQVRPDLFEMQGIAETELVDHLQQAQWTLQNMTIDNLHLTVMRGITYREGGVTDPNQLELRPRFKWPVSDHQDIQPFEVQPVSTDIFTERQRLLSDMQLVTGITPFVSSADLNSVDQNTATGVTALQETASRLLAFKASQIQHQAFQPMFQMWGDMVQQFLDKDIALKITGNDGKEQWVTVSPQEVAGHFDYVIEGTEESLSRQQERAEAMALLNAFVPLVQIGAVKIQPVLERVASAYNMNPDELVAAPPQQQAPAAPGPQYQQNPTGGTVPITQLLGGQQMNPVVQNAINQGR